MLKELLGTMELEIHHIKIIHIDFFIITLWSIWIDYYHSIEAMQKYDNKMKRQTKDIKKKQITMFLRCDNTRPQAIK